MARLLVCDQTDSITVDIEAWGPVLAEALESEQAESVVRCAVMMALSALAEGGTWPRAALQTLAAFMDSMKQEMRAAQLT